MIKIMKCLNITKSFDINENQLLILYSIGNLVIMYHYEIYYILRPVVCIFIYLYIYMYGCMCV